MSINRREQFVCDFLDILDNYNNLTTIREILNIMNNQYLTLPPFARSTQVKLARSVINYLSKTDRLIVVKRKFCYNREMIINPVQMANDINCYNKNLHNREKIQKNRKKPKLEKSPDSFPVRITYMGFTLAMSKDSQVTLLLPNGDQIAYDGKTLTMLSSSYSQA